MTRSLDFYQISAYLRLVDLPGYGFAFAKEEDSSAWNLFVRQYIENRKCLKRVFLLVDCRQGLKQKDRDFLQFMEKHKVTNQVIVTKSDLLYPDILATTLETITNEVKMWKHSLTPILIASSFTKSGVLEIQKNLTGLIDREKLGHLRDKADNEILKEPKKIMSNEVKKSLVRLTPSLKSNPKFVPKARKSKFKK